MCCPSALGAHAGRCFSAPPLSWGGPWQDPPWLQGSTHTASPLGRSHQGRSLLTNPLSSFPRENLGLPNLPTGSCSVSSLAVHGGFCCDGICPQQEPPAQQPETRGAAPKLGQLRSGGQGGQHPTGWQAQRDIPVGLWCWVTLFAPALLLEMHPVGRVLIAQPGEAVQGRLGPSMGSFLVAPLPTVAWGPLCCGMLGTPRSQAAPAGQGGKSPPPASSPWTSTPLQLGGDAPLPACPCAPSHIPPWAGEWGSKERCWEAASGRRPC